MPWGAHSERLTLLEVWRRDSRKMRHLEPTAEHPVMQMLWLLESGHGQKIVALNRTLQHGKENVFGTLFGVADINYFVLVMCIFLWEFHKCVQCIWIISTQHSLSDEKICIIHNFLVYTNRKFSSKLPTHRMSIPGGSADEFFQTFRFFHITDTGNFPTHL